jgi:hypothetical protein
MSDAISHVLQSFGLNGPETALVLQLLRQTLPTAPPDLSDSEQAAVWLRDNTQRAWLRPAGQERWELPHASYQDTRLRKLLATSPFACERRPVQPYWDNVLLMSAIEPVFVSRLRYLRRLFADGMRAGRVFLLGGERRLLPHHEAGAIKALGENSTEIEMLIHHAERQRAKENILRAIAFLPCSTPYQPSADGSLRRPNTLDTVKTWQSTCDDGGSVLCLTNQPYVLYQTAIICSVLGQDRHIQGSGPAAEHNFKTAIVLDALARWIYVHTEKLS